MLKFFNQQWDTVPLICIDTECTGKRPGYDKTVSFGLTRFENGRFVASYEQYVNPGVPIPEEATLIHGITDEMVKDQPALTEAWNEPRVQELLADAQPGAYNGSFDRYFIPPFGEQWDYPWLDALTFVRKLDRYSSGKGRHKLSAACERHGVGLVRAHSAAADSRACGELMYVIGRKIMPEKYTMGQALGWQGRINCEEWFRFNQWIANQPPLEEKK